MQANLCVEKRLSQRFDGRTHCRTYLLLRLLGSCVQQPDNAAESLCCGKGAVRTGRASQKFGEDVVDGGHIDGRGWLDVNSRHGEDRRQQWRHPGPPPRFAAAAAWS